MRTGLRTLVAATLLTLGTAAHAASMTVIKSPTCGCCVKWIEHVRAHGFDVKSVDVADIMVAKKKAGVPDKLASCHTAIVGGYVVEGHVPAADIKRLLAQKPKAKGIAVAGMPMGSPGMEHGNHREPYNVILFKADGSTSIFSRH